MTQPNSLKALTSLALTLIGAKEICAETRIVKPKVSMNYGRSDESKQRYRYDLYGMTYATPVGDDFDVSVDVGRDVMAGASTVYQAPSIGNRVTGSHTELEEQRSGASIVDYRNYISGTARFFGKDSPLLGETYHFGATLGTSREQDYISHTLGAEYGRTFNENNTELTFSATFNDNTIRKRPYANSELAIFANPSKTSSSQDYNITLRQDINKHSYVTGTLGYRRDQGYLADPYKAVFVYGDARALSFYSSYIPNAFLGGRFPGGFTLLLESRPNLRHDWTMNLKYVYHFTAADSSLHLDYRFMKSSWDIRSHTFSVMYVQPFAEKWEVAPSIRYYTQHEAFFHSPLFRVNGGINQLPAAEIPRGNVFSSDYRLSSFGSIDTALRLSRKFLADESAKVTFMAGMATRRNAFYWGTKSQLKNKANDFNDYYGSVTLAFELGKAPLPSSSPVSSPLTRAASTSTPDSSKVAYKEGTFSIKPFTMNFGGMILGYRKKNALINEREVNTHRSVPGWGGNRAERHGSGWDIEVGYFPLDNFEVFGIVGFTYEKPLRKIPVGPLNNSGIIPGFPGFPQFAFDFKPKFCYTVSLGSRYYWAMEESRWTPFIGGHLNLTQQDSTDADVSHFEYFGPILGIPESRSMGPIRLQGRKTIYGATAQFGADYKFTETVALTLLAGIQYTGKTPLTITQAYGATFSYKDRRNTWNFPVMASLKISL